jgi:predicted RNase H-like nuclease (RuvC/YqgF family)
MSTINELKAQLETVQAELLVALAEGRGTRAIRAKILTLQSSLADAQRAVVGLQNKQQEMEAAGVRATAELLAKSTTEMITAATSLPQLLKIGERLPDIEQDQAVNSAANTVASARAALEKAELEYLPLQAEIGNLQHRISEHQNELTAIKQRRINGDRRPDDAGAVTLLEADLADIQDLLSSTQARTAKASPVAQRNALNVAEMNLVKAQSNALLSAANSRLKLAEEAFLRAYHIQREAERTAGINLSYPSGTYRACQQLKHIVLTH